MVQVRLLGRNIPLCFLRPRLEKMWKIQQPMRITPLSNGYFIVSFSTQDDLDYAYHEGPWMIDDH